MFQLRSTITIAGLIELVVWPLLRETFQVIFSGVVRRINVSDSSWSRSVYPDHHFFFCQAK